ncbi:hypothetical protein M9458_056714 [Cirrhinus mrigala]|uniref:Uncharacterized protein n=1 Tax=Cirrhinus mrigala TaxID=683832 RepID=A0ABD0MGX4_CIRMR
MDASQTLREVSAALWRLGEESVIDVCRYLKCEGLDSGESRSRARRALIKMAEGASDEFEENMESEEIKQYCADLLTFIERHSKKSNQPDQEDQSEETDPKKGLEFFLPHPSLRTTTDIPLKSRLEPTHPLPEVTLRREFKICGQTGKSGQRNNGYISARCQVKSPLFIYRL